MTSDDICKSCDGAGKWPEFLPDDVDCMACGGTGRRDVRPSEAAFDEFADGEGGEFPAAFIDEAVEIDDVLAFNALPIGDPADA